MEHLTTNNNIIEFIQNMKQQTTIDGVPVLTTAQIAEIFGTTTNNIQNNFVNNRYRYEESKHFYRLQGDALKAFLNINNIDLQNNNKIRTMLVWSRQGASLLAKSLNTNEAWRHYDYLVDYYYNKQQPPKLEYNNYKSPTSGNMITFLENQLNFIKSLQNQLDEHTDSINAINATQVQQAAQIAALNNVNVDGDTRKQFRTLVAKFAAISGIAFNEAWRAVYKAIDNSFNICLTARLNNYMQKNNIKKMNRVDYLELTNRLNDAIRVVMKLIENAENKQ